MPTVLLSKDRYLSPAIAAAERERLWPKVWLHAAPRDLLPRPGSFLAVELGGAEVLLIRGRDGVARAFHNVCPHRGRRLVDAPCGDARALLCPLHNWQWHTDGTVANIPQREQFGDLPQSSFELHAIQCEESVGQVWIHLGRPEQPLHEWLAPMTASLVRYDLDQYALDEHLTYDLACNWKTCMDLSAEAYHLSAVHPYLFGMIDERGIVQQEHEPHLLKILPIGRPSPRVAHLPISEALAHLLRSNGVDPAAIDNDPARAADALRAGMRARGITKPTDDELLSIQDWFIFPALNVNAFAHEVIMHRFRPRGTDPERMWYDQFKFRRLDAGEARPAIKQLLVRDPETESHSPYTDDDVRQALNVQRGMRSRSFAGAQLGGLESFLVRIHARIDEYLARP